jgi:hypothetical protein
MQRARFSSRLHSAAVAGMQDKKAEAARKRERRHGMVAAAGRRGVAVMAGRCAVSVRGSRRCWWERVRSVRPAQTAFRNLPASAVPQEMQQRQQRSPALTTRLNACSRTQRRGHTEREKVYNVLRAAPQPVQERKWHHGERPPINRRQTASSPSPPGAVTRSSAEKGKQFYYCRHHLEQRPATNQ